MQVLEQRPCCWVWRGPLVGLEGSGSQTYSLGLRLCPPSPFPWHHAHLAVYQTRSVQPIPDCPSVRSCGWMPRSFHKLLYRVSKLEGRYTRLLGGVRKGRVWYTDSNDKPFRVRCCCHDLNAKMISTQFGLGYFVLRRECSCGSGRS